MDTRRTRLQGNAMIEYTVALTVLFAVVAFASMIFDFPKRLTTMTENTLSGMTQDQSLIVRPLGSDVDAQLNVGGTYGKIPKDKVCFTGGKCLQLPVITVSKLDETAGGLGGDITKEMANVFDQIIQRLKEAEANGDEIDPNIILMITRLSNSGHSIADNIINLERRLNNLACGSECTEDEVSESNFRKIAQARYHAARIEYNKLQSDLSTLQNYLDMNPDVLMEFPEAKPIIELEARQIQNITKGLPQPLSNVVSAHTPQTLDVLTITTRYTEPKTGKVVTETRYELPNGVTLYHEVSDGNKRTAYKYHAGEMVPTSDPPPGPYYETHINDYLEYDIDAEAKSTATLIRQDANIICTNGGIVGNCVR